MRAPHLSAYVAERHQSTGVEDRQVYELMSEPVIESANAMRGWGSRRDHDARRSASSLPRSGTGGCGHSTSADGRGADQESRGRTNDPM